MGTVGIHNEDRLARCRTNFFDKKDWAGLEAWSVRHLRGVWSMRFRVPLSASGATRFIQQWAVALVSAKLIFQKLRIRQTKKQAECGHRNQRYSQESSKNRWQTFKFQTLRRSSLLKRLSWYDRIMTGLKTPRDRFSRKWLRLLNKFGFDTQRDQNSSLQAWFPCL